jgi:Zn-dependent protease
LNGDILQLVLVLGFLILCLGIHEAAHAWVAHLCGDDTAKDMGRLTLNPVPHIDPFMTIILPAILVIGSGGRMMFGGARPVPVNPYNLRHRSRDMMLVALAGPASNFVLAVLFMVVWKVLVLVAEMPREALAPTVIANTIAFNILLAAFNMVPIPPLDGSRVMAYFLPSNLRESYVGLERFGMLLVFAFVFYPPTQRLLYAVMDPMWDAAFVLSGGKW